MKNPMIPHLLILGGTTEARALAGALAGREGLKVTLSLAGRTSTPADQLVPTRHGGFGGATGLAEYIRRQDVSLLIDATHPFAAKMSGNAARAARLSGIVVMALRRPAWEKVQGDRWIEAGSVAEAAASLGGSPKRVLVAIGRQELAPLEAHPQHFYLIRSIDPVEPPPVLPHARYLLARGPFAAADEERLLTEHRIEAVLAKNSGGAATYGKIAAARALGIPVHMVTRPKLPDMVESRTVEAMLARIDHHTASLAKRGE